MSQTSSVLVSVDYSSVYGQKRGMFSRNVVKVDVTGNTKVSNIKSTVLEFLNIPYLDLYFVELKGKSLPDEETVSNLMLSTKTMLSLKCSNFEELYNRMRADRRL
jgi:hypothetical protein